MTRDHRRSINGSPKNIKGNRTHITPNDANIFDDLKPKKSKRSEKTIKREIKKAKEEEKMDLLNARDVYRAMIIQQKQIIKSDPSRKKEAKILIDDYLDKIDEIDAKIGLQSIKKVSTPPKDKIIIPIKPKQKINSFLKSNNNDEETQQAQEIARGWIIPSDQITSSGMDSITGHNGAKMLIKTHILAPQIAPQFFDETKKPNRTFLFMGPPGTGKTELAKAIAKDSKMNFMEIRASELLSKWAGVAPQRVRAIFTEAAKKQPIIIFIDEADDLFDRNNKNLKKIANEFNKTISDLQISDEKIYIIAATNKPEKMDGAAIRRFMPIRIDLPMVEEREAMFETRSKASSVKLTDIDFKELAKRTEGYSGSDIAKITSIVLSKPLDELITSLPDINQLKGISPDALRQITMDDYIDAINDNPPSTSKKDTIAIEKFWENR